MSYKIIIAFVTIIISSETILAEKILVIKGRDFGNNINVDAMVIPKPKDLTERYVVGNKYRVVTYSRFGFKQEERVFNWRNYPASQNCEKGSDNCSPYPAYKAFRIYFKDFKSAAKIKIFEDGKLIKEMPIDLDPAYLRIEETP